MMTVAGWMAAQGKRDALDWASSLFVPFGTAGLGAYFGAHLAQRFQKRQAHADRVSELFGKSLHEATTYADELMGRLSVADGRLTSDEMFHMHHLLGALVNDSEMIRPGRGEVDLRVLTMSIFQSWWKGLLKDPKRDNPGFQRDALTTLLGDVSAGTGLRGLIETTRSILRALSV